MSLLATYIGIVYLIGLLLFLGGGITHEHGHRNPLYGEAVLIAFFWPLAILHGAGSYTLDRIRDQRND